MLTDLTRYNVDVPPPKKPEEDKRTVFVKVYLTSAEKARMSELARAHGLSLAAYVRMIVVAAANSAPKSDGKK